MAAFFKWGVSETPYLIHEAPKAPHITGCGVLLVVEGLWGCPLDWNLPSFGEVVALLRQIT